MIAGAARHAVRVTILGSFLAGAIPAGAVADVRYAEPDGDGPEPCLSGNPCDIQIAVEGTVPADVEDGDEVVVKPGEYLVGADMIEITDDIEVHGEDGAPRPTIVSTATTAVSTNMTGDALIRDLVIRNNAALGNGLIVAVDMTRVEVHVSGGAACAPFFPMTIRDSICHSSGGPQSAGLALGGGGIANYDFRAVNLTAVGAEFGITISTNGGFNASLSASNVIAEGGTTDVRALAEDAMPGTDADAVLDHSAFQTVEVTGTQASATPAGSGTNVDADPLLANPVGGNFHQLAGSPTRNAGSVTPELGSLDIDRQPRVLEGAPDIGADEHVADRCGGRTVTVRGTAGRDLIRGTGGPDVIATLGGRDTVRGRGGRDLLCGGKGSDRLLGGRGRDRLLGGAGPDLLRGGPGRDTLRGGPGRDRQLQ